MYVLTALVLNEPATDPISTLSLHDALPISHDDEERRIGMGRELDQPDHQRDSGRIVDSRLALERRAGTSDDLAAAEHRRSAEHTSELQSPYDLVCRLLLEKRKTITDLMKTT